MRIYRLAVTEGGRVKASREFDSKDKRDQFLSDLKRGTKPEQFTPLDCGGIDLKDDFRPYAKKKLVCIYQSDSTDYFELMP
jgi:hypothetical protein